MADVGPTVIPSDLDRDDAVVLTDAYPTGNQAAEMGEIRQGETVVVFGAGPVGIFAAKSACLLGARRVIVVDHVEYRLDFVQKFAQCEIVNFKEVDDMALHIKKMTDWMGADVCIDAVGCEAAGNFAQSLTGIKLKLQGGSATVLHWCINSVRKGGKLSIVGVYGRTFNAIPIGSAVNKGLTLRMNHTSVKRHLPQLIEHIQAGRIKPSEIITHRMPFEEVADVYYLFPKSSITASKRCWYPAFEHVNPKDGSAMNTAQEIAEKAREIPARFAHIKGWVLTLITPIGPRIRWSACPLG